jgi:hypothetical protein
MAELTDQLRQMLDERADTIGGRIGADPDKTRQAIDAAVPALLAAFASEAERGEGIKQAIRKDHDGSILDQLPEYLQGNAQLSARTTNGQGILEHTLGGRQQDVAHALSAKSGLDMSTVMRLLPLLAPIVMGMLGKKGSNGRQTDGGGFSLDDLGSILGRERDDARSGDPGLGDLLGGLLGGSKR